jgi:hypothetical protein
LAGFINGVISHFFNGYPESPSSQPFIPVIASGIPELFKMKESCVEPGHFTTIFVNLEEENIYKYIIALEA